MVKKVKRRITAGILVIGNEDFIRKNDGSKRFLLASWLNNNLGIKIGEVRIVPDILRKQNNKKCLALSKSYNYVLLWWR